MILSEKKGLLNMMHNKLPEKIKNSIDKYYENKKTESCDHSCTKKWKVLYIILS